MRYSLTACLLVLLLPTAGWAQDNPPAEIDAEVTENAPEVAETDTSANNDDAEKRITELEQRLEQQQVEFSERIEALEEQQQEEMFGEVQQEFEPTFQIYGFLDLTLNKHFTEKDGFFDGIINDNLSFMLQHLNIYFASQMTESLAALVELRFTFFPHGDERGYAVEQFGLEYERVNTEVDDPFTSEEFNVGGVVIERAHMTWKPAEFFGVVAGRYLTPFGIWNVEHGTPVLLPIRHPVAQVKHVMPLAQTGVQVFGNFYPSDNTKIHYAVTASNGRGPTEALYDLDNHKGLGLRLRFVYNSMKVKVALGGYGYLGTVRDITKSMAVPTDGASMPDTTVEEVEKYHEYVVCGDFLLEVAGLRVQAEMSRGLVRYDKRPLIVPPHGFGGYSSDYIMNFKYALLGYTLPLARWLKEKTLTPYVMVEHAAENDMQPSKTAYIVSGGLNFKPSAYVVVKLENFHVIFPEMHADAVEAGIKGDALERFWGLSAQLAVSF